MTIRRRLSLSFLAILALFAVNLTIFEWGNTRRTSAVLDLRQAVERQLVVGSIQESVEDQLRQIRLRFSGAFGLAPGENSVGVAASELGSVRDDLEAITRLANQHLALSGPETRPFSQSFIRVLQDLRESMVLVYSNYGSESGHTIALVEMTSRTEPLGESALKTLAKIFEEEAYQVDRAGTRFNEVAALTESLTFGVFGLSILLAIIVALRISRHFSFGIGVLEGGVAAIGAGDLDHRIPSGSPDEFGKLAGAFNRMTENLQSTQQELQDTAQQLESRHEEVEKQREVSEGLLQNILPGQIAAELQGKGKVAPKYFEDVSILFLDFVGFTLATEKLAAEELVDLLHVHFTAFDKIIQRYGLEKLKTIGDAYMCAGGLPVRNPSHPVDMVLAAFELVSTVAETNAKTDYGVNWKARIGIHTGPVIAGVVGIQKFAFDIWGETVNHSSRMESSGEANQINLSGSTYSRVKDFFSCHHRGKIKTKERREFDMYFAEGILPKLAESQGHSIPPEFVRRYQIYFEKDPPAFPAGLLGAEVRRQAS